MSDTTKEVLGSFLKDVSNWYWDEFAEAEHDNAYTSNQSIIFALVRAIAMEKLDGFKIAVNRLDGKLKTPIKIETPKIYYIYPNATEVEPDITLPALRAAETTETLINPDMTIYTPKEDDGEWINEDDYTNLPSLSLRQTLRALGDAPREMPLQIIKNQELIDEHFRGQATALPDRDEIPRVKSVISARVLKMSQDRKLDAMYEVFDQIDGKLVETIEILGEDVYIPMYGKIAPMGAIKNKDGMYMVEAADSTNQWAMKLTGGINK